MAGAYPGDRSPEQTRAKLGRLLDAGVRVFVSLMEEDERDHSGRRFVPYMPVVERLAAERGISVSFHRFPIRDLCAPTAAQAEAILTLLQEPREGCAFVHCWGGRGRTGSIVGCYLIRRGLATTENFVDTIRLLRAQDAGGGTSPETSEQVAFVRAFSENTATA